MNQGSAINRALLVGLLFGSVATAQTSTGTLEGTVRDTSGGAVVDARVRVTDARTGVGNEIRTGAEGSFVLPFLLPGTYNVAVDKAGFRRLSSTGLKVDGAQARTISVVLEVGEVNSAVEVKGESLAVSSATSTVATTIDNKRIVDMPLNGRNAYSLALLTPGVVGSGGSASPTSRAADIPYISGGRSATSEVTIDGTSVIVPTNNVSINDTSYQPPVDAIEEFTIQTNALAAEYGRTGGGVINVATKHGGNQFHGSLYEFLRNSKLNSSGFFNNRNKVALAAFQSNMFGFSVGGPVLIPGVYNGRNRTFFFVDYQGQRDRTGSSTTQTVPLDEWKRGDFSNLKTAAGAAILVYDPLTTKLDSTGKYTRDPFAGNVIPAQRMDPIAKALMSYYPSPNATPVNANTQVNNFYKTAKSPYNDDRYDIRLDHAWSDKFRMFGRYSHSYSETTPVNFFGNMATPSGDGPNVSTNYSGNLDATYMLSATSILNVRYGFGRFVNLRLPFSEGFDISKLGFPAAVAQQAAAFNQEFPNFSVNGLSSLGQATFTTLKAAPETHVLIANLTKMVGRHTVKGGAEFRKILFNEARGSAPDGEYSFGQGWTQQNPDAGTAATAGFGLASMLLGLPGSGDLTHDLTTANASAYWGAFIQDDFRLNSRLTLNFGARYEVDIPRTERYNRYSYWDPNAASPIAGQVPGYANLKGATMFVGSGNRHQTPTDRNNIGPRFGFAYKVDSKMVARGAYALMYAGSAMVAGGATGAIGTDGFTGSTLLSIPDSRFPVTFLSNPFPAGFNLPTGTGGPYGGTKTGLGGQIQNNYFIDYRNPVIQQWNFTLQREVAGNTVLEAGYIGSKGQHLIDGETITYNQLPASAFALGASLNDQVANPFYGIITNPTSTLSRSTVQRRQLLLPWPQYTSVNGFRKPQGNSIYHALTLKAEKRMSKGLSAIVAFTGGKLIDDTSSTVTFIGAAGTKQDVYNRQAERAVSTQDISSRLVSGFVYDLPFGKGRRMAGNIPAALDYVIGGWQVNGILTLQTGNPIIVAQNNNSGVGSASQRPNSTGRTANIAHTSKDQEIAQWFDTTAFTVAPAFSFGNVGRTLPDVRNPGTRNADLSLFKNFNLHTDAVRAQFRAEAFNATNTSLFNGPATNLNNSNVGTINSTRSPRLVQLALKFLF